MTPEPAADARELAWESYRARWHEVNPHAPMPGQHERWIFLDGYTSAELAGAADREQAQAAGVAAERSRFGRELLQALRRGGFQAMREMLLAEAAPAMDATHDETPT